MADEILDENVELVEKAFEMLNVILEHAEFVAGENLTIADFSICMSVSTAEVNSKHIKYLIQSIFHIIIY